MGGIGRAIDEVRAQQDLATVERQVQSTYVGLARGARGAGRPARRRRARSTRSTRSICGAVPSLAQALDEARDRRTDVKLLDARVASAKRVERRHLGLYMPYLAAVGQPFVQEPPTLLQPTFGWQAQLLLTLPLYDGGLRSGIAREREALLAEARANLEAALRQAPPRSASASRRCCAPTRRWRRRATPPAWPTAPTTWRPSPTGPARPRTSRSSTPPARPATPTRPPRRPRTSSRQARLDLLVASGRFPGA